MILDVDIFNEWLTTIQVDDEFKIGDDIKWNWNTYIYSSFDWAYINENEAIKTFDKWLVHEDNDTYYTEDTSKYFTSDNDLYYTEEWNYFEYDSNLYYVESDWCYYESDDWLVEISWSYYYESDCYRCDGCEERHLDDYECKYDILSNHGDSEHQDFSNWAEWRVWLEIEKSEMPSRDDIIEIKEQGWSAEEDRTVSWWEYITPILNIEKAYDFIKETWQNIIENYGVNNKCWWHIHLSHITKDKDEVYKQVEHYRPILWGLYPTRILNRYCNKDNDINDRYRDLSIRQETIEFRIFTGVKSLNQIRFRIELIKFFITNPVYSKEEALALLNTKQKEFFDLLDIAYWSLQKKIIALTRIYKFYELDINDYKKTCKKIYKVLSEK